MDVGRVFLFPLQHREKYELTSGYDTTEVFEGLLIYKDNTTLQGPAAASSPSRRAGNLSRVRKAPNGRPGSSTRSERPELFTSWRADGSNDARMLAVDWRVLQFHHGGQDTSH